MNRRIKRNLLIVTVVLFVSAAAYLNWNYFQGVADVGKILGESQLVDGVDSSGKTGEEQEVFNEKKNYFDTARLKRQEARDSAVALLKEAAADEKTEGAVVDDANRKIQKIAADTLSESNIENQVLGKGYTDCVAFLNDGRISVVIAGNGEGLAPADIAKVADIVMEETGLTADKIKITEAN